MTPIQYQTLCGQIADVKRGTDQINAKLDDALEQLARHDERLKTLERGAGATLALAATLGGAWLKAKLHL